MPHLMFSGPPGVGKTTCAKALARDIYSDGWKSYVLDANGSDDRGIQFVREVVKNFARTTAYDAPFKVVFLDEVDAMTPAAQDALRRIMEDYATSCRFILSCNEPSKVIPAIRSRCAQFEFGPIEGEDILDALLYVCEAEGFEYEPGVLGDVVRLADGSMRDALNIIETLPNPITHESVVNRVYPKAKAEWKRIIKLALTGQVAGGELEIVDLCKKKASPNTVFEGFYEAIRDSNLSESAKNKLLVILGEYHYRCATGGSFLIQGRCFLRHIAMEAKQND